MRRERHWAAVVSREWYAEERLYAYDSISFPGFGGQSDEAPRRGDHVALVAADPPQLFGLGRVRDIHDGDGDEGGVIIGYTRRLFDEPPQIEGFGLGPGLHPLTPTGYARLAGRVGADRGDDADKTDWMVSLALPIEAASAAEAVREFWTHIGKLGPRELPAFVWPRGDELAMQAYVLGDEANLDPEEDGD